MKLIFVVGYCFHSVYGSAWVAAVEKYVNDCADGTVHATLLARDIVGGVYVPAVCQRADVEQWIAGAGLDESAGKMYRRKFDIARVIANYRASFVQYIPGIVWRHKTGGKPFSDALSHALNEIVIERMREFLDGQFGDDPIEIPEVTQYLARWGAAPLGAIGFEQPSDTSVHELRSCINKQIPALRIAVVQSSSDLINAARNACADQTIAAARLLAAGEFADEAAAEILRLVAVQDVAQSLFNVRGEFRALPDSDKTAETVQRLTAPILAMDMAEELVGEEIRRWLSNPQLEEPQ